MVRCGHEFGSKPEKFSAPYGQKDKASMKIPQYLVMGGDWFKTLRMLCVASSEQYIIYTNEMTRQRMFTIL